MKVTKAEALKMRKDDFKGIADDLSDDEKEGRDEDAAALPRQAWGLRRYDGSNDALSRVICPRDLKVRAY